MHEIISSSCKLNLSEETLDSLLQEAGVATKTKKLLLTITDSDMTQWDRTNCILVEFYKD